MWRNLQQLVAPDPADDDARQYASSMVPAPPMESTGPSGWEDDLDVGDDDDDFNLGEEEEFVADIPKPDHCSTADSDPSRNGGWDDSRLDHYDAHLEEEDPWADNHHAVESEPVQQPIHVVEEDEDSETKDAASGWDDDNIFDDEEDHNLPAPTYDPAVDEVRASTTTEQKEILSSSSLQAPMIMAQPQHQQQFITSLQVQHEQDLQKQYAIIDQKSSIIQSLEQKCWQIEQVCDQRCRNVQTEMETLASELISTVQERDMLLSSLHTNVATIQQLQNQIDQVGDIQNEQHHNLQQENVMLQEEISQSLRDVEGLQQTLLATQSENIQLRQQLHEAMSQASKLEGSDFVITNLRQENDALHQERQMVESKFEAERILILERHAEEQKALLQDLDATQNENASLHEQVVALQTEGNSKGVETAQRDVEGEQRNDIMQRLEQIQEEMEFLQTTTEHEKATLIEQQNEERSRLQAQMQFMEMECQSWQVKYQDLDRRKETELQDAVQNGQRAMEETLLIPLQKECDQLRQRIIQLEGEVVSCKQTIMESDQYVDEQAKWYDDEIQQLRQEISSLQLNSSLSSDKFVPAEEMQSLRTQHEQLQTELHSRDEQVMQLINECQKLQHTVSLHHLKSDEPPELEILRSRLQVALDERDALAVENEDLLVQFGYMKQKMDSADEYILSLQGDIKSLQTQLEEFSGKRMSLDVDLNQKIQILTVQKNEWELQCNEYRKQIEEYLHLNTKDHLETQAKLATLEVHCKAKIQMVEKLTEQLENNGLDSLEPEDVSFYRERVRVVEAKCESLEMELNSVRSQLETTEGALNAKEQLYSIQSAVYDLESSVPFQGDVSRFVYESEAHILELQQELNSKSKVVEELQGSVMNLKFQLDDHGASKDSDMETAKKDGEIQHLKQQVESIQANLASKEEQLNRLLATESGVAAYNHMKEVDSLRSNIVSVARALQRSETNRADTISRLVSEREAHVLQLRSMSEKLKRFYSTVTYGHV